MDELCGVSWFAERDIDVWLAEELKLNGAFARWLLKKVDAPETLKTPAAETHVSIVQGRETDVEAIFSSSDGRRFALLIEDKIKANFQPNQMADYFKRGDRGKIEGRWNAFAVLIFSPGYRVHTSEISAGAKTVSFEEAADFLRTQASDDFRAAYRAEFLQRASSPRAVVARDVSELATKWWEAVNSLIRAKYGSFLREQVPKTTSFVSPRWVEQPSYLRLDIKGYSGEVALALIDFSEAAAKELLNLNNADGLFIKKKAGWKDPAICVAGRFPKYDVGDDLSDASEGILIAYGYAHRLFLFWQANRVAFDSLASG